MLPLGAIALLCARTDGSLWTTVDYDGDHFGDTLQIGDIGIHLFWTGGDGREEARPIGSNWEGVLRHAVTHNDFVFEFLHRDDSREVAEVTAAARGIVGDAATEREKVQRLLGWLGDNWDFTQEHSVVNAAALLARREGMCETSGFVVGMLDALGIRAREVTTASLGPAPQIAVEAWLDRRWRVVDLFGRRDIRDQSTIELMAGREGDVSIVYYWRDPRGRLLRSKLWFEPHVARLFEHETGLSPRELPDLRRLRISY
jgi:transglutaminase superfamily protein